METKSFKFGIDLDKPLNKEVEECLKMHAMTVRKVAYHDTLGVFLGVHDGIPSWSKRGPTDGTEKAPTFLDYEEFVRLYSTAKDPVPPLEARMVEVFPNLVAPNAIAVSSEEVKNSGLPGWGG